MGLWGSSTVGEVEEARINEIPSDKRYILSYIIVYMIDTDKIKLQDLLKINVYTEYDRSFII